MKVDGIELKDNERQPCEVWTRVIEETLKSEAKGMAESLAKSVARSY